MTEATPSQTPPSSASLFNLQHLKSQLKKYGRTGIVTYLGLSTCVTAGFYVAIQQHLDVAGWLGISKEQQEEEDRQPSFAQKFLLGSGSTLALAILCSKMTVPIKLPVAVALTPYVHRAQERLWTRLMHK